MVRRTNASDRRGGSREAASGQGRRDSQRKLQPTPMKFEPETAESARDAADIEWNDTANKSPLGAMDGEGPPEHFQYGHFVDWRKVGAAVATAVGPAGCADSSLSGARHEEGYAIEAAARLKNEGSVAFGRGDFDEALAHFSSALVLCRPVIEDPKLPAQLSCLLQQLQVSLYNNRALVHLRQKSFHQAASDANVVLNLDEHNVKALYRRAMAHRGIGKLVAAENDLRFLCQFQPANHGAKEDLAKVVAARKRGSISSSDKGPSVSTEPQAISTASQLQADNEAVSFTITAAKIANDAMGGRGSPAALAIAEKIKLLRQTKMRTIQFPLEPSPQYGTTLNSKTDYHWRSCTCTRVGLCLAGLGVQLCLVLAVLMFGITLGRYDAMAQGWVDFYMVKVKPCPACDPCNCSIVPRLNDGISEAWTDPLYSDSAAVPPTPMNPSEYAANTNREQELILSAGTDSASPSSKSYSKAKTRQPSALEKPECRWNNRSKAEEHTCILLKEAKTAAVAAQQTRRNRAAKLLRRGKALIQTAQGLSTSQASAVFGEASQLFEEGIAELISAHSSQDSKLATALSQALTSAAAAAAIGAESLRYQQAEKELTHAEAAQATMAQQLDWMAKQCAAEPASG